MLIGGSQVEAFSGETLSVENPATTEIIAYVPRASDADVERAVSAARDAFPVWRVTSASDRGRALQRIANDLRLSQNELAMLLAAETGNAIRTQSRPEIGTSADVFDYFGASTGGLVGSTTPINDGLLNYTRLEPIGVTAGIIPWNSPVLLGALKIAMALATGNTLVLKAAEDAPLAVLRMAEIASNHLPPGVLNVLTGHGEECGAPLVRHRGVDKISFTGSTEVGKEIMLAASARIARVSLELGGKSPTIVFPDADDDAVVDGVITAMRFTRQGQSCTAGSRLFLHSSIFDSFLNRMSERVQLLKIGDPLDEQTDVGALISRKQYDRVCDFIDEAVTQGATAVDGTGLRDGLPSTGYFLTPTIFHGVGNDWRIYREEVFGPVLVAVPWDGEAEVVAMANDSHYGLAAFVWSRDIGAALRTAHAVDSGWVQVNRGGGILPGMNYGGFKESGLGSEYSLEGAIEGFTRRKNVTVNIDF
jgi:betaine-aldehyde dehydrogenase